MAAPDIICHPQIARLDFPGEASATTRFAHTGFIISKTKKRRPLAHSQRPRLEIDEYKARFVR
jgi:hypothetical protein